MIYGFLMAISLTLYLAYTTFEADLLVLPHTLHGFGCIFASKTSGRFDSFINCSLFNC